MENQNKENKLFRAYTMLITFIGLAVCVFSFFYLRFDKFGWEFFVIATITLGIGSRISVGIKYSRASISVSDVFTFLIFLLYGTFPAVILSAVEAYFSSSRHTVKRSFRFFNSGVIAISFFISFQTTEFMWGSIENLSKQGITTQIMLSSLTAVSCHYIINAFLIVCSSALRFKQSFYQIWKEHYIWMFVPFLASGSLALVSANMIQHLGFPSFLLVLPIIGILYFTYQSHQEKLEAVTSQAEQTEKHLVEMSESEERFRSAFSNAPIGIGLISTEGKWLQANESLCNIFGVSEAEILSKSLNEFVHPKDILHFLTDVGGVIQGMQKLFQAELRYYNQKGEEIWTQTSISRLNDAENSRLICQIQDITAKHQAEEKLRYDASYDSLTELANRAVFMQQLNKSVIRAGDANEYKFAVIFVDLDKFKLVNDSIGHTVGDKLLVAVAKRLKKCLPADCTLARFGSDEFLILLDEDIEVEKLTLLVEEIQKQVNLVYGIAGQEISITSSIGVVYYDDTHHTAEDVLRDADTALHIAKTQGRSRYVFFDEQLREKAVSQMRLEKDLQRAVERNEFYLVYQPIIALADKKIVGFEALIRWNHPQIGFVSPLDFISIAEENGTIVKIGKFVLDEACRQMRIWQNAFSDDFPLTMSVNVSAKQLLKKQLLTEVLEIFEKYQIAPNQVKLEITESVIVENSDAVISILKQFRAMGVKLSMDDFGTGYSSLSYLHKLPINTLKIDRSFVSQMTEETESAEIVKTIVLLAKNLHLDIVAEGIETAEQHQILRDLGCEFGQGYHFSKPLNVEDATDFINDSFASFHKPFTDAIQEQPSLYLEH